MGGTVVGIDVGTTKMCTLVGEVDNADQLRIVGVGVVPSRGLRKGVIVSVDEAAAAIAASIQKAERISGYKIENAYVGVAGSHIASLNTRGVVAIGRGDRPIMQEDVDRAMEAAQAVAVPHNRQIIHAIPRGFSLDDQEGVRNPIGLMGYRLEVEAHIVTGAITSLRNLASCVQNAGVGITAMVLQPLASAEAVLRPDEREMGVVLVDAGGGTIDVAIFIEGSIWHSLVLPVGGNHITNDIAIGLRIPFDLAEELKLQHGHALPEAVDPDEVVDIRSYGHGPGRVVAKRELATIIEARAEEMFEMILREIKRSGYDGLLPAGVVLTGGTARLAGLVDLGQRVLNLPVRVGAPTDIDGLVESIEGPAYSTSVGMLLWGIHHDSEPDRGRRPGRGGSGGRHDRFLGWLREFLPR
ncbi:MAG TPA: cell division protein FtsA [Anaerolineae bacterium]|nr:cell division protein FtsA [Anaerolineae bacterium]HPL26996.1 cell division protein FtsA [Anaerolineae bacterium]